MDKIKKGSFGFGVKRQQELLNVKVLYTYNEEKSSPFPQEKKTLLKLT